MKHGWVSLTEIARTQHLTLGAARRLAEREHWPKVFKQHETFVLPRHEKTLPSSDRAAV